MFSSSPDYQEKLERAVTVGWTLLQLGTSGAVREAERAGIMVFRVYLLPSRSSRLLTVRSCGEASWVGGLDTNLRGVPPPPSVTGWEAVFSGHRRASPLERTSSVHPLEFSPCSRVELVSTGLRCSQLFTYKFFLLLWGPWTPAVSSHG